MRRKLPVLLLALIILLQAFVPAVYAASENEAISSNIYLCPFDATPEGAAEAVGKKPIVIGENMQRVKPYADEIGGHAYKPWKNDPFDFDLGMKRNQRWINDMKKEGREIIDIGPDFSRRSLGREPSPFYNMERTQLKGYENYRKAFERDGRLSGGVPGLDS